MILCYSVLHVNEKNLINKRRKGETTKNYIINARLNNRIIIIKNNTGNILTKNLIIIYLQINSFYKKCKKVIKIYMKREKK